MLQLKACLLLLVIATDPLLGLPSRACNGHMNMSEQPTGHLDFSPGQEGAKPLSSGLWICTRTLEIPPGHSVQLKLVWLESGSNMSLVCTGHQEERTLAVGDSALLHGCDQNRATLTWTGAGHSSNAFQLFYYVQEKETSSTESYSNPRSLPDVTSPHPTTNSTDEVPLSGSVPDTSGYSTDKPELIQPTIPPSTSGNTDREASLFPGEESNNGPDTSGAPLRTDNPAGPDFFSTQHLSSARSEFYTPQNTEFQTVTLSNEVENSGRTYATIDNQTLIFEQEKDLAISSVVPLLDIRSTTLPQNASGTTDENKSDSTEKWESSGTHIDKSLGAQITERIEESSTHRDFMHSTSTLSELGEPQSTTGSTKMSHVTTKSGKAYIEIQSVSTKDTSQTTSMSFDPSENSKKSTQETTGTENFLGRQLSSLGSSSPLETAHSYVTQRDLTTFRTSTSSNLASTDPLFGARSREDAKTSPRKSRNFLTTSSYFGDATSNEERSLVHHPTSTPSLGENFGRPVDFLSTVSPSTISAQTFQIPTDNGELFPKTGLSRYKTPGTQTVSASTLSQLPHTPHQAQSGKYRTLPTTTVTDQKAEQDSTTATASGTPEPVSHVTTSTQPYLRAVPFESSTLRPQPKYYIVPDEPVIVRVESIELLLQIMVEESPSSWTPGWEEDVALWLMPYLQKAPGFKELNGVWNSDHAVQCLVQFDTRGALQWLPHAGASSLLERTGLKRAVGERRSFRDTKITNITLGGVQEACGWLLQCPSGFMCAFDSHTSNYSCTSVCHSDYCLHHGLCTHHPAQSPVCRCVAGQDFWYMGQRCEVRMTRARLVLSCLAVLLVVLGVVGVLACMAVRRYRALLIQAKVDQTRSSYRKFNHFDELSGRFWLRSWAGSADSMDNHAFSRSDEILQLRALERPCCYHDDSLSLPSTCPSPATHIRTIYPHSSQYAWRGSDLSMGDGVFDSGKASDLSVCSWPREPIQWSPFPLLQQLALQRPPAVRVPRTRSCCDGMELVDINKSWTA